MRTRMLGVGLISLALGMGLSGIPLMAQAPDVSLPGIEYPSQGNTHVQPGEPHPPYDSNPPTSGWHYPIWPRRGIYVSPLPEESLLHFMEHAGASLTTIQRA